jgi:hypothetical protein
MNVAIKRIDDNKTQIHVVGITPFGREYASLCSCQQRHWCNVVVYVYVSKHSKSQLVFDFGALPRPLSALRSGFVAKAPQELHVGLRGAKFEF